MLDHVKKVIKFSAKVASSTKNTVEHEVGKFVKKHKVPVKEGKLLVGKIVRELRDNTVKLGDFIADELRKELKRAEPYVKKGKKVVKKSASKAKKEAKKIAKKALQKAKGKTKKVIKKVVRKVASKIKR